MWSRLVASLGYRPPLTRKGQGKGSWERYGVGPHNLPDLATSLSQAAMNKGFNPQSADYYAGHTIDDLGYRQLHDLNPKYRREQYQIVEPYLNVISNPPASEEVKQQDEKIATLEARLARLESLAPELRQAKVQLERIC